MIKVSNIDTINCKKLANNSVPTFKGDNQQPKIDKLADVNPDYNVKVPISYQKTGEMNLPYDYKVHCYKMANGHRVYILPKEDSPTVVKTFVATGSMNEPDHLRGISHYIEHNLFNGSEGLEYGEFDKKVNEMGGETNATTGMTMTDYYIISNLLKDSDLETKIKLHASMLETPKFAVDMLEKEKGIVNSEINMYTGDVGGLADNTTLKTLYNIKTTSSDLVAGTVENITNLTREDVVDYYNNNYFPANMVTVITGEINPEDTMKLMSKYFAGTNKVTHPRKFEELNPIDKTVRKDLSSKNAIGTNITLGFNGFAANSTKEEIAFEALKKILAAPITGRANQALKKYNTSLGMGTEPVSSRPQDNCAIMLNVNTNEENCEKVLQEVFNQVYSMSQQPVSDEELQTVKKVLKNRFANNFDNSESLNDLIGINILYDTPDYMLNYDKYVDALTKEDILNVAKKYLDLNKTAITVIHPEKAENKPVSFTGNMNKEALNPNNVKRFAFQNNIDLITNNSKTNMSCLDITFETEYINKNVKPGTVEILNGLLDEGSMFKDAVQFKTDLNKNDINIAFNADHSDISVFAKFASEDMQKAFTDIKEVLYNPRFTQESFDEVKSRLIENLKQEDKSVYDKLIKELYKDDPASYTKDDILNNINNITLEDVKTLYYGIIQNAQGHVCVSAPFDKQPQLQNTVFNEIMALPYVQKSKPFLRDTYKPVEQVKVVTDVYDKPQAEIIEAFKFQYNGNLKDDITIDLMNTILGGGKALSSRLFKDLREQQQLCYRVRSKVHTKGNTGSIELFTSTTTDNPDTKEFTYNNVQKSIDSFNKQIQIMKTQKVTPEELECAKLALKNEILSMTESTIDKNLSLAINQNDYYGALKDNEALKIIDSITAEDIYNAANYVFKGKPLYSVLASENTINANQDYFKNLENI